MKIFPIVAFFEKWIVFADGQVCHANGLFVSVISGTNFQVTMRKAKGKRQKAKIVELNKLKRLKALPKSLQNLTNQETYSCGNRFKEKQVFINTNSWCL